MSESNLVRVRRLTDGTWIEQQPDGSWRPMRKGKTDWERLRNMTEEEIEANALSDPDNPPLTDEELERMRSIPNPTRIRERLGMTPLEFAEVFEISVEKLNAWEAQFPWLDFTMITFLRVIEQNPEGVKAALEKSYQRTR